MGHMGMNPVAAQSTMRTAAPTRHDPAAGRAMEQMAMAQKAGIGTVPPRKRGGKTP